MTGGIADRPRLARGVRLAEDRVRGGHNLLGPEHVLRLNDSGAAIVALCDGEREVAGIVATLAERYGAAPERIEADVRGLLADLAARRMIAS